MSRLKVKHSPILFVVCAAVALLPMNIKGQASKWTCKDIEISREDHVLLQVTRRGRGMIWPNLFRQMYFKLYDNGLVEYDAVKKDNKIETYSKTLKRVAMADIQNLLASQDLLEAKSQYPLLEDFEDALMKTCVSFKSKDQSKTIMLVNYTPHARGATGYYPTSLVELLELIEKVRPRTAYEQRYGFDKLGYD